MIEFETVIGIEVHAQLLSKSKTFCACSASFGSKPNTNVCPVCLGMPGALPVLNEKVVELAITAGFALNCEIQEYSVFARKNYFYPDLPKGYQISQFDLPICTNGFLDIEVNGIKKRIGITRIHIEEDAGKLLHQGAESIKGADYSLVDLNRASVPLIEIVSEPDIRSVEEAKTYVQTLKKILLYLAVCDGNLEEGSLRADVNLSLRQKGQTSYGTRSEIKNINSFRSMERAINSEIIRQTDILQSGGRVIQQTRNYDDTSQTTTPLRSKEEAHDYRYFPDPDLIPLKLNTDKIKKIKKQIPELPQIKHERYRDTFGLTEFEITTLLNDIAMNTYFEKCLKVKSAIPARELCKWVIGDLNALIKDKKMSFLDSPINPEDLDELITLIDSGKLSRKMAKDVLIKAVETGESPSKIVEKSGAALISDQTQLKSVIEKVLSANPDAITKIKAGKTKTADFLMGQVMRETRGQAQPDLVRKIILELVLQAE
ncbi:Asp-tRNA(Asn)/Glu-tRNA(Gln) amidotransferase subunit GatB [Thermoproteota archaeon]